ncbi:2EXR domain-containing protein [Aspergillus brunneoviolaceus CBS 621.78]|uniref:Uncharacterized protein n=1 Tax=Aspergillus brunneoviolaceus CBS 621.78 TaxID=1450534 RepID=A0ACD1GDE5_9EURO|nr:hypothetical protein BO95DRAFT_87418 [Aspergillus brunneoviolaceus CBS 621.78]RAH47247.1 hypothetical protein BO95DRAFT_87418 [Aspergillus brunneoviolaceus CBS 621.78]
MKIINPVRDLESPRTERLTIFHPFLRLPPELQLRIWEMCLEDFELLRWKEFGIISLYPMNTKYFDGGPGRRPQVAQRLHIPVPPLKQVCHTSRHVAEKWLRRGQARRVALGAADPDPDGDEDYGDFSSRSFWKFSVVRCGKTTMGGLCTT